MTGVSFATAMQPAHEGWVRPVLWPGLAKCHLNYVNYGTLLGHVYCRQHAYGLLRWIPKLGKRIITEFKCFRCGTTDVCAFSRTRLLLLNFPVGSSLLDSMDSLA